MTTFAYITPIYAGFFGIMLVLLSWRVTLVRKQFEGHHKMNEAGHTALSAAVRAQSNIVEYLPMALLLMWMLETMEFDLRLIHGLGVLLVVARLMHLHGLNEPSGNGVGRKLGTRLTWLHIVICSILGLMGAVGVII